MEPMLHRFAENRIVELIEKDGGSAEIVFHKLVYTVPIEKRASVVETLYANRRNQNEDVRSYPQSNPNKVEAIYKRIHLLKAPQTLLGSQFHKDFEVYKEAGIPVIIDADLPWHWGAAVDSKRPYSDNPLVSLRIGITPSRRSSLKLRHERQHLYDLKLNKDDFRKELPALPKSFDAIYDKIERGEPLNWLETRREAAIHGYLTALLETRASEGSLKILFSPEAMREIFLSKRLPFELIALHSEIINSAVRYGQRFYYSMLIQPTASRNMLFLAKALAYWCAGARSTRFIIGPVVNTLSLLSSEEVAPTPPEPRPVGINSVLACGAF